MRPAFALALFALMTIASNAHAQGDLEPRAFSNAPIGLNFLVIGYAHTQGGLPTDPPLPVTAPNLTTSNAFILYERVVDFWGKNAKVGALMPYTRLSGSVDFEGQSLQRAVNGFGYPYIQTSINLIGAPALTLKDFQDYKQNWIVGLSFRVQAPVGQYDGSKLVNIGTNRWSFRPQMGVSKAVGNFTLELTGGVIFYTDNKNFLGGAIRSQNRIYSSDAHVIYNFPAHIWASLDANYFTGGQSTINGIPADDRQGNWRTGATLTLPVNLHNSVKLGFSKGAVARTGNSVRAIGIGWQYSWGGGL